MSVDIDDYFDLCAELAEQVLQHLSSDPVGLGPQLGRLHRDRAMEPSQFRWWKRRSATATSASV